MIVLAGVGIVSALITTDDGCEFVAAQAAKNKPRIERMKSFLVCMDFYSLLKLIAASLSNAL
jgi:hypothetical protein